LSPQYPEAWFGKSAQLAIMGLQIAVYGIPVWNFWPAIPDKRSFFPGRQYTVAEFLQSMMFCQSSAELRLCSGPLMQWFYVCNAFWSVGFALSQSLKIVLHKGREGYKYNAVRGLRNLLQLTCLSLVSCA
jgi:hypothetical protein